ncbi:MAG: class I SAM-dependent methyltransferase [Deltaproteobacteria bacterium]|nr:class I SAM-dependent methyltransferase [Deltaproteobacteria bacterium]
MLPAIPSELLRLYEPFSFRESLYLRARWRLCPFETIEALVPRSGKILDFGCGYGILANLLSLRSSSRHVRGLDRNKERISVAMRSTTDRNNIAFTLGDVGTMQIESYDGVVMTDVMHHLSERNARVILRKIRSCLRLGGILVILDVDRSPFWKFWITYSIDRCLNPLNSLHYRSSRSMTTMLEQFSFAVHKIIPAHRGLPLSDIIYLCQAKPA